MNRRLNPDEFAEFVTAIRGCAAAIGESRPAEDFGMSEAERGYRSAIRRHVVAARDLKKGTRLAPARCGAEADGGGAADYQSRSGLSADASKRMSQPMRRSC